MIKIYKYFLVIIFCNYAIAKNLPLPSCLNNMPVYYEETTQINGWSCGYNALFNACRLEKRFGRNNSNSDLNFFKNSCLAYLKKIRQDPKSATSNALLERLASPLHLSRVHYLSFDKNTIAPMFLTATKIIYPNGTPQWEINRLMEEAKMKRADNLFASLKRELDRNATTFIIHFLCHIEVNNQGHAVLASIVKNIKGEKAIYIFDNMNSVITENSQMKCYINYLCTKFDIKSKTIKATRLKHVALGTRAHNW